jgi:hypothetical protein
MAHKITKLDQMMIMHTRNAAVCVTELEFTDLCYAFLYRRPASAEVKKTWIYTSIPPYAFMA